MSGRLPDPFSVISNPAVYGPRPATERAIAELESQIADGSQALLLTGPSGIGKTLLLRVLGERLAERFVAFHVPYPDLGFEELCAWVLESAQISPVAAVDQFDRLVVGCAERGDGVLLLIDEAQGLPAETVRALEERLAKFGPVLRVVAAATVASRRPPQLAPSLWREVPIHDPMSEEETQRLLNARLVRSGVPSADRFYFRAQQVNAIHRKAEGNPARVLTLAGRAWYEQTVRGRGFDSEPTSTAPAAPPERRAPTHPSSAGPPSAGVAADAPAERAGAAIGAPRRPARMARGLMALTAGLLLGIAVAVIGSKLRPELPRQLLARGLALVEPSPVPDAAPTRAVVEPIPEPEAVDAAPPAPATVPVMDEIRPVVPEVEPAAPPIVSEAAMQEIRPMAPEAEPVVSEAGPIAPPLELNPAPAPVEVEVSAPAPVPVEVEVSAPAPAPVEVEVSAPAPVPVEVEVSAPGPVPSRIAVAEPLAASEAAVREPGPVAVPEAPARAPAPVAAAVPAAADVAPAATLAVNVNAVPWAVIEVDGREVGETPLADLELSEGEHRFVARFPDGRRVERVIDVSERSRRVLFE